MLYNLVVLAALVSYTFAAPLSSCEAQAECIDASITEQEDTDSNGNALYEICLIFDATLDECVKDESDDISHACVAGSDGIVSEEDGEKIEGLSTGDGDSLCDIIPCGTYTTFGLKDGRSCELDGEFLYANLSIPNYDEYLYCYSGMSCNANGKNDKACKWAIKAPDCETCPDTLTTGDDCDFDTDTTCEYGTVTCCDEEQAELSCSCGDDGKAQCAAIACVPDDECETDPEPCECQLEGERVVAQDVCIERCDGACIFMDGDNVCAFADPADASGYPAIYNRARMDETELVTVPETDTDGTTDGDVSEKKSKAGIINLSIVSIVLTVLYLLQ